MKLSLCPKCQNITSPNFMRCPYCLSTQGKPKIKLPIDGDVYSMITLVIKALKEEGQAEIAREYLKKVNGAREYSEVLNITLNYVEVL